MTKQERDKLDEEWAKVWAQSVASDKAVGLIARKLPKQEKAA